MSAAMSISSTGLHAMGYISESWVPCRSLPGDYWPSRKWHAFLITSVATPFLLAIPVLLWMAGEYWLRRKREAADRQLVQDIYYGGDEPEDGQEPAPVNSASVVAPRDTSASGWKYSVFSSRLQYYASRLVSDQMLPGQMLKVLGLVCAMGSLFIYFHDSATACLDVEMCHLFRLDVAWQVDLAFNCYLLLYYILRFCAHHRKLWFIFHPVNLADYFTIPPIFVAIGLSRNWYGLRYLRIVDLVWLVELLRRMNVIRTVVEMQLARLVSYVLMAVVIGAGSFLLLECAGDPWDVENTMVANLTYWNMAYFSVVTISTVGYGDLGCKTLLGRLFTSLYIFACLFFIASFIASAASLVPGPRKYPRFDNVRYVHHVLLCGHITVDSVRRFLNGFYDGRIPNAVDATFVLIVHQDEPEGDMLLLLHDYQSTVEYIQGSPLEDAVLDAAQAKTASACLVVSNFMTGDTEQQDSRNILLVAALKGYCRHLRVHVQVSKPTVASFLRRHYHMDGDRGDMVSSVGVVQTGLVGMSGVVPGFVPFCLNLLSPRPLDAVSAAMVPALYRHGCQMRLDSAPFSPAFHGLTFAEAAQICYDKLHVLLLAVFSARHKFEVHSLIPNPRGTYTIGEDTWAQAIVPSPRHAQAIGKFCSKCHWDVNNPLLVTDCHCYADTAAGHSSRDSGHGLGRALSKKALKKVNPALLVNKQRDVALFEKELPFLEREADAQAHSGGDTLRRRSPGLGLDSAVGGAPVLDSTGYFHWCPPREFDDCVMTPATLSRSKVALTDHIILILTESADSSVLQVSNILLPLRKSFIPVDSLKEVIVVCRDEAKLRAEWLSLSTIPRVRPVVGDPIKPAVLRACCIQECDYVIILSCGERRCADEHLMDQGAVIMTAHIRSMEFVGPESGVTSRKMSGSQADYRRSSKYVSGREVPVLTMLGSDKSARFLSSVAGSVDYRCTVPYLTGSLLPVNDLQDMLVTGYRNPSLLRLFTDLIFGGESQGMVNVIAEGVGLMPPDSWTAEETMLTTARLTASWRRRSCS
ncbi:calcium-activated potassium channel slo-1-like [Paramacrobiotus metropolitanus]|uniref:calcium-activated potassium channel slo-1-like n=1 Tax=Paramacrobiotus metropolitanus TaxID=2943436 RepID=UPI0024456269|nr:calcium-activated potassium channel slo-1-like [Paramacrobiotus metropolitanus]XP_055337080.1 calcium-activated potassium channel slo-1-like [Paramacrobiotus metropolitanus]XP_055337082.1 calcium-activated potassium channel slo-1-like [Paramacrobiotus metropolitanus]XP_055337083.1 calcium-activated potassium channel slo-1-like [Paramacrobiotus metropolitanus]XP_055337084.1 calcium-activated potassium channel slo-1-like [Paramacrobiotus metropolitanus]XP_055337085.1 calcium-activated potassi